jgi:hypothetical protein
MQGTVRTRNRPSGNSYNKKLACREQLIQDTCMQRTDRTRAGMQGTVRTRQARREQIEQEIGMQGAVTTRHRHAGNK